MNPYSLSSYLRGGALFLNNALRPRHKRLGSLMIYATSRCQSRCQHCSIWQKPHEDLTLTEIAAIVRSRCVTPHTVVGLEGGEFILHPEADAILAWFDAHHPCYTLLTNGLASDRVSDAVARHRPTRLYVSLDGPRDTYCRMRGRDGYDAVLRTVRACRDRVPVSLMFCLSPWNGFDDLRHVIHVARDEGADVRIGIYGTLAFFDTHAGLLAAEPDRFAGEIPDEVLQTQENFDYLALYGEWRNGTLRLPCRSICSQLVVHSNGNVPLCQNLDTALGNIREQPLDAIFNSAAACAAQRRYGRDCNGCWINYHRKYDIILHRTLERWMPRRAVAALLGDYQWSARPGETYRQFLARHARRDARPADEPLP